MLSKKYWEYCFDWFSNTRTKHTLQTIAVSVLMLIYRLQCNLFPLCAKTYCMLCSLYICYTFSITAHYSIVIRDILFNFKELLYFPDSAYLNVNNPINFVLYLFWSLMAQNTKDTLSPLITIGKCSEKSIMRVNCKTYIYPFPILTPTPHWMSVYSSWVTG